MKLIRCHIENFGKLQNVDFDFSTGFHVFLQKNGWGKSTLAAFIKVMFYGFEHERNRDDFQNERKRFRPWQGGVYGGSLTFECEGKVYVATRIFGTKEKEDVFSLREEKTNLETEDYTSNLGEEIFKIDSASFGRTVFLSQNDCKTNTTDSINAKISHLAENTDDMNRYEIVDRKLGDLLNSMSPTRKTGSLYKMKEEIASLDMDVKSAGNISEVVKQLLEERQKWKEKQKELKVLQAKKEIYDSYLEQYLERKKTLDGKRSVFALEIPSETDIMENLEYCSKLATEEKLASIYEMSEEEEQFLEKMESKDTTFYFLIPAAVSILVGLLCYLKSAAAGIALMILGVICAIVSIFKINDRHGKMAKERWEDLVYKRNASERASNNSQMIRNKLEGFLEFYGFEVTPYLHHQFLNLLDAVQEHEIAFSEFEKAQKKMNQFEEVVDVDDTDIAMVQQKLLSIERRLEELQRKRDEISEKEEKLELLKPEYDRMAERYKLLGKTREHLAQAKSSFTARYMRPLQESFAKYYEIMTGEKADSYLMDANIHLTYEEQGMPRETKFLSAGYGDLIGICMRMALIDAMYQKERPFIILDDPFVNLDEEKTEKGLKFLKEIAKDDQIIYFTCHESRISKK